VAGLAPSAIAVMNSCDEAEAQAKQ